MVFPGDPQVYLGDYENVFGNIVEFPTDMYIKSVTFEVIAQGVSTYYRNYYEGDVEGRAGLFYLYKNEWGEFNGKFLGQSPIQNIQPGINRFTFTEKIRVYPTIRKIPYIEKTSAAIPGSFYFIAIIGRRFSLYWYKRDTSLFETSNDPDNVPIDIQPLYGGWGGVSWADPGYETTGIDPWDHHATDITDFSTCDFLPYLTASTSLHADFVPGGRYHTTYEYELCPSSFNMINLNFIRQRALKS